MSSIFDKHGMDIERVSEEGRFVAALSALPQIVDVALRSGQQVTVLGRTSNDPSGRVIFSVEDAGDKPAVAFKGELYKFDRLEEGVFTVSFESLMEAGEAARKNNLALRLLDTGDRNKLTVQVQLIRQTTNVESFPQDFWMNRVSNAPNMSTALLEVLDRRS